LGGEREGQVSAVYACYELMLSGDVGSSTKAAGHTREGCAEEGSSVEVLGWRGGPKIHDRRNRAAHGRLLGTFRGKAGEQV